MNDIDYDPIFIRTDGISTSTPNKLMNPETLPLSFWTVASKPTYLSLAAKGRFNTSSIISDILKGVKDEIQLLLDQTCLDFGLQSGSKIVINQTVRNNNKR